ncbi:MAG: hypothetical protein AVDCRST_MAG87-2752, partial [uncultured Thermomicrobiales bacterium]
WSPRRTSPRKAITKKRIRNHPRSCCGPIASQR